MQYGVMDIIIVCNIGFHPINPFNATSDEPRRDKMNGHKALAPSPIMCNSCGAHLEIKDMQEIVECPYCGTRYSASDLLNESDAVRAARIKAQCERELEAARMMNAAKWQRQEESKAAIEKFKRSGFSKFLIVCTVISSLVAISQLSDGAAMAGMIALVQAGLYLTTWLMGTGVIRGKKKSTRTLIAVIAFALIIPFFMFCPDSDTSSNESKPERFAWTDIEMHKALPEPINPYGEISRNSQTALFLTLCDIAEQDFKAYKDTCIAAGYTIDADESSLSYSAYNQDGYNVHLIFSASSEKMKVYLYAPEQLWDFEWPANGLGAMLPATQSNIGSISQDNSLAFLVHVGNTTLEEYQAYVKACEAEGFIVDYSRGDTHYSALNAEGYKLILRYLGFNKISILLKAPEDGAAGPVDTNPPQATAAIETVNASEAPPPAEAS
nr:hypothetical protein [bacterium]